MRFAFLPADDENTASSRMRVYTVQRALDRMGVPAVVGYSRRADVLFVQKKVTRQTLRLARFAKARGAVVLYDVDDLGESLWYWAPEELFAAMLELADAVTTATPEQGEHVRRMGARTIEVLPCPADYYPEGSVRLPLQEEHPLRILWFGDNSNIDLFKRYASTLGRIPDAKIVVIVNKKASERLPASYPEFHFLPWSLSTLVPNLQSCHLACLMHDGGEDDRAKSNNRMVASITWGVPCVVTRTPDYERAACAAGVPYCLFDGPDDLPEAIERLRSAKERARYLDAAQPVLWREYAPEAVARRLMEIAGRYRGAPRSREGASA